MAFPTLWRTDVPTNWNDLFTTRREIDRVFDRFFGQANGVVGPWTPVVDVRRRTTPSRWLPSFPACGRTTSRSTSRTTC
jgi:hypothetical protein